MGTLHNVARDSESRAQSAVIDVEYAMTATLERLRITLADRYRIERELGQGGMATVYLAHDLKHDRSVALKVLRAELAQALGADRFLREIRIAARLEHPHILALFDSGDAGGFLYYVMPFVDGESLRERMTRDGPLPISDALRMAAEVADALSYAHARGVVHRDIKPENVLLSGGHAKLADFGIAIADGSSDGKLTQTGVILGTPAYMSPEQLVGDETVDGRSDLYSLACVLFEMLAGEPPFAGANPQALMARRFTEDAPRVVTRRAAVPLMVDMLLARALASDPAERQATIGEFGAVLIAEISGSSAAVPAGFSSVAPPPRVPLVGREKEIGEARAFLTRLVGGKGGLLLIGGEPGVGKTRLSGAIMDEARAQRALCVTGRCYEMEGMPPFTPFAELLDTVARLVPLRTFRDVLGDAASELSRIQPSLRQTFPDLPAPLELAPDQQRRYLFNKYREYVERACKVAPIVLLLDDLHWGDEASLSLLEHIAGYAADLPLFILGTYRDVELEVNRPFARVLESLTRHRLAIRLSLRRLDATAVAALLTALGGSTPPAPLVRVIFHETEGNPFFVEEVFQHLQEEGRLFDAAGAWRTDLTVDELDVPEGVRLVIGRRLERLSPECRAVLSSAAVIGSRFDLSVLEALGEQSEDVLFDAIDDATRAHLVVEQRGARAVVYTFAHELIRQTLLAALPLPRRQRRHLKIASAMEAAFGDRADQRVSDLAYHLYQAGTAAPPDKTIRMLTLAAERAVIGAAFTDALDHCDRAATIDEITDRALSSHLLRVRGAALKGLGRWPEACDSLSRALEGLYAAGDPAASAVAFDLALLMAWATENGIAHQICAHALERLAAGPSADRVRLLALDTLVEGVLSNANCAAGVQRLSHARSMATELGDTGLVGLTDYFETMLHWSYGRFDPAISMASDALARLVEPADVQWRIDAAAHQAMSLTYAGRYVDQDSAVRHVMRRAREVGHAGAILLGTLSDAQAACQRSGDVLELEERLRKLASEMTAFGPFGQIGLPWAAMCQVERGDREGALSTASGARRAFPIANQWTGFFEGCELWCMAAADHPDWSLRLAACLHSMPLPGFAAFAGQRWFAIFLFLSHLIRGEQDDAAALYPVLREALDDGFRLGPLQPLEGLVGAAAAAGGKWKVAEQHLRSALALVEHNGDRLGKPSVQKWYAWMLLHRASPGDSEQARALLDEAMSAMRTFGMHSSLDEAEQLLARCTA
jgi:tRNA A-37 threonylcarbamoyl transferase component Bud32/tetratricopeptide (TPR) repeat protein